MSAPIIADLRTQHFERLYKAFYDYFAEKLRKDASAVAKFKLHLSTEFFDDLDLYKSVNGLFSEANTNPAEKRAVARAALWDALVAHAFGAHLAATSQFLFDRVNKLEERIENVFSKREQAGEGPDQGVQKQDDSVGLGGTSEEGC